jgi:ATP-dependent Clp protease ATP-binding subunit ClpA
MERISKKTHVSRLAGSPGYVGYGEGAATDHKKRPIACKELDEVEKARPRRNEPINKCLIRARSATVSSRTTDFANTCMFPDLEPRHRSDHARTNGRRRTRRTGDAHPALSRHFKLALLVRA